jgi:N-sulfoglucosamine sulfohydrolase
VPADQLAASERNRPNIILSVADDHGRGDLGCYGNPVIRTPNIDKLAGEGVRFTNAFCTTASCSASRSVILSGLYSHFNGQYGHQHDYHHFSSFDRVRSLPVLLSQGGYRTARIGKYHVAPDEIYRFDAGLQGNDRNAVQMADNCAKFFEAGSRARAAGILPANQGRDALAMEQPFFLYFSASDPHEVRNLADDPQHKDTPDRKKAKLKAFQKQTKDPWVLKWEYE